MNLSIKQDIEQDIQRKLSEDNIDTAEKRILEKMDQIKNRETRQGKSPAKGGRWDNTYNRQYANRRKGGRRSPVTLRDRREDIEDTRVQKTGKWSELRFQNRRKGVVFGYHDKGVNYSQKGFTKRQVYPDADNQVPESLDEFAENAIFRLLRT